MQEIDYAEMLEIPVSTVNVTKKRSFFKRKETPREELKEQVVDSVNERVGAYVEAENLSDPPAKQPRIKFAKDRESIILFSEIAAVCVIAMAIFLTNIFMPTSVINTFISSLTNNNSQPTTEPTYNELKLSSVVSDFSDADVNISDSGVITFTADGCVYPVCDGTIASVSFQNDKYVVEIAHTSSFSSVVTGLKDVYLNVGDKARGNLPFAYSDGQNEVSVSLYDGDNLLNCFSLSGEVPVWNS